MQQLPQRSGSGIYQNKGAGDRIGVSPSLFDEMVNDGRMPRPKVINSRRVWDIRQLDIAFNALPDIDTGNPWDQLAA
jgi:hypothetical protein